MSDKENSPLLKGSPYNASVRYCDFEHTLHFDAQPSPKPSFFERRRRRKLLKKYNEHQKHLKMLYKADDELLASSSHEKIAEDIRNKGDNQRNIDTRLASITFALNIFLLFANATASVLSGSLSIISLFIDSTVDSVSGVLIFISAKAITNTNMFNYPRGRARLELVVVLICSIVMGVANIMMIVQAVKSVVDNSLQPNANLPTLVIVISACFVKTILMYFCYKQGTPGSRTLALDQRNDILTGIVALFGAYIGDHYWLYADPLGAVIVCTVVAGSWFHNALDNIPILVGRRSERDNLSRIMRVCIEHDVHIKCLDHVMVYHTGPKAIVEVHIVLDENLSLKITHDIIESLTQKLKTLSFVERAFVHGDYRCDGDI